jgi:CheY-like chemotaxis protein
MEKKILIIDDEADARTFLEVLLTENGYRATTADGADDGLIKAKGNRPDLILLDIIMPNETGVKLYREFHADPELSKIPVIIVSGVTRYKELFARDHATMPKPFAFVEKPVNKTELLTKISQAIG